jgi:hypothetical protein
MCLYQVIKYYILLKYMLCYVTCSAQVKHVIAVCIPSSLFCTAELQEAINLIDLTLYSII